MEFRLVVIQMLRDSFPHLHIEEAPRGALIEYGKKGCHVRFIFWQSKGIVFLWDSTTWNELEVDLCNPDSLDMVVNFINDAVTGKLSNLRPKNVYKKCFGTLPEWPKE